MTCVSQLQNKRKYDDDDDTHVRLMQLTTETPLLAVVQYAACGLQLFTVIHTIVWVYTPLQKIQLAPMVSGFQQHYLL